MITRIDREVCIGCGVCSEKCPSDVIHMDKENRAIIFDAEDCMTCFLCERNCPAGAIVVHPFKAIIPSCFRI